MRLRPFVLTILIGPAAAGMALADEPGPPAFKAGFAERDITPAIGMEMPGNYGKAYHKSIHDPCKVRASVFDDGRSKVAIVGVDGLGIRRDTVVKARRAIREKTGIAEGSILVGASHSHSSGPLMMVMPGEYDHAPELVRKLAYEESSNADPGYVARVEAAITDAVNEAHERRVEAKVGVGKGVEATVAFNRRFRMKDGRTVTHPGLGNPEIVEPAGPVDPEVGVVGAWDAKAPGKLLGCVVNFSCHATTGGPGASASYIHYLEKVIRGYYGQDCVVVFEAGASGDITQVDNRSPHRYPDGDRWAQIVGGKVGAEAVKTLIAMDRGALVPVAARTRVWQIPRRAPSPEKVRKCLELVQNPKPGVDPTTATFAKETVLLDAMMKKAPKVEVEVQAVQVGPALFVTTPAEYFCQFGLEIKAASGFPFTFPVSLANGCVGYVPTEEAFGSHGGGYETRLTSYSNLEITAGSQMRDAGIALARQLRAGPIPEAPRRPAFKGEPWSYGNVPPERE